MRTLVTSFVAFALVVAACGGSQTQPTHAGQEADAAAPPASASASAAPAEDAGPPKPTLESQRAPFMATCMRNAAIETYCTCAFEQFKDVFKDADLLQKPSQDQLESVRKKTLDNCASKLTDAEVKPSFTSTCVGAEPRKQSFCDCMYTSFRKRLQPPDFASDFQGPKFDDAKKAMTTECKGKLPEQVEKEDFLGGCGKAPNQTTKSCECMWKKLRSKASVEQLAVGLADLKSAAQACQATK